VSYIREEEEEEAVNKKLRCTSGQIENCAVEGGSGQKIRRRKMISAGTGEEKSGQCTFWRNELRRRTRGVGGKGKAKGGRQFHSLGGERGRGKRITGPNVPRFRFRKQRKRGGAIGKNPPKEV